MSTIKFPYFGSLDGNDLETYYDVNTDFNGRQIQIDLNFEHKSIDFKRLEMARQFIENLRIHDLNNKKMIRQDFEDTNGEVVRDYISHHIEELAIDDIEVLVGSGTKSADQPALLVKELHLVRVGLYPYDESQFAVFDYSLGKELTDYLVVISTDENGNPCDISMES